MDLLERTTELETLEGALAAVCSSGRGSLVLVTGEAGIGKTALLDTFCEGNRTVPTLEFSDGTALTNPSLDEVQQKLAALV